MFFDYSFILSMNKNDIASLTIAGLVNSAKVSVRLKNSINQAVQNQHLSFATIEDFLAAEDGIKKLMFEVPSLGKKTANEFVDLIKDATKARGYVLNPAELSASHNQKLIVTSNKFLDLYKEGFNYKDIAELHDVSETTVRKYLKENPDFSSDLKVNNKSNIFLELSKDGFSYKDNKKSEELPHVPKPLAHATGETLPCPIEAVREAVPSRRFKGWDVCRFHGARGGRPTIHGIHTKAAKANRKETNALIADYKVLAKSL